MMEIIFYSSLGVLFGIGIFLCLWCKYNDGLIGKAALAAIAIGAGVICMESALDVKAYQITPEIVSLLGGLAVFWLRHVTRRLHRFRKQIPARRAEDKS